MTRLETWIDEEVALLRQYDELPPLTPEKEQEYREALGKTLHGEQLRCADAFGEMGDSVLATLKRASDQARDSALAEWFKRCW